MTLRVGWDGDETPYPFRPDVGQQYGYELPDALAVRLAEAQRAHDAVTADIRQHIKTAGLPLLDLDSGEEVDEEDL